MHQSLHTRKHTYTHNTVYKQAFTCFIGLCLWIGTWIDGFALLLWEYTQLFLKLGMKPLKLGLLKTYQGLGMENPFS